MAVQTAPRPARVQPAERTARWTGVDTGALTAVTVVAGALRLFRVTAVSSRVFDEAYYAVQGCMYVFGPESRCDPRGVFTLGELHPPLGKWLIAIGIRLFGNRSGAWRLAPVIAGTLTVIAVYLLARKILRSTLAATIASGALAIDFLHFVHSRVAMLDVFVTLFAVCVVLFVVYDADGPPAAIRAGRHRARAIQALVRRRWRLAAGVSAGAAVATKWSGLAYLLTAIALVFVWQVERRRLEGTRPIRRAVSEEGPSIAVTMALVPALVYVATYVGRLQGAVLALPWARGSWGRAFLAQQRDMLAFHVGLDAPHVYASAPWSWPLLKRPIVYEFDFVGGRYQEILALGSPLVWWSALIALAYIGLRWRRRRRTGGEGVILAGFAAGWLPWLVLAPTRDSSFMFYLLPSVPFMCLAVGYVAARIAARAWGWTVVEGFAAAAVALFGFYYPVLAAVPISQDSWRARILFADCDLEGVTLSRISLAPGVTTPPDVPGPYPEATIRGGGPPSGWCWI